MDRFDIFKDCKCLYTPSGAAREYAPVGCNFYRGCPYQCEYCYNRKGLTAGVMGLDHAVLESCFVSRPKKYLDVSSEDYAFAVFKSEVDRYLDYLKDMGIFFSFSTDPMSKDTLSLTMSAMLYATSLGIPVKILTKNTGFTAIDRTVFREMPEEQRRLTAIGYTLTGRDDQEPYASPNADRVRMMKQFHEWGFRTFASIEPIVDFDSSYRMIRNTSGFCDQYLIGLMSKRSHDLPPYETDDFVRFIRKVVGAVSRSDIRPVIYWKDSLLNFIGYRDVRGSRAGRNAINKGLKYTVMRNYSLSRGTSSYPIRTLAKEMGEAVAHLEGLRGDAKDRKRHETALISFFRAFHETNDFIDYSEYLAHSDMETLYLLAMAIYVDSLRFIGLYRSMMDDKEELKPFWTKIGKEDFQTRLLYALALYIRRISSLIIVDIDNIRKEQGQDGQAEV